MSSHTRSRTSSLLNFSWGVEHAAASVTVPYKVLLERRGGLTDRRPGANMDPYLVTMMLVATCCGVALPTGPKARAARPAAAAPLSARPRRTAPFGTKWCSGPCSLH